MRKKLILFFLIIPILLFSQKNHLKTFYRGDKGVQYFIKPIKFKGPDNKDLLIDFTINVINDSVNKIVSNFSISDGNIKTLDIGDKKIDVKKLFDEYESREIYTRYNFELTLNNLRQIFIQKQITIKTNNFQIRRSFVKESNRIYNKILSDLK